MSAGFVLVIAAEEGSGGAIPVLVLVVSIPVVAAAEERSCYAREPDMRSGIVRPCPGSRAGTAFVVRVGFGVGPVLAVFAVLGVFCVRGAARDCRGRVV